jgi:integrase
VQLFEAWQGERRPAPATLTRWKPTFKALTAKFPDVAAITDDAAREWFRSLVTPERSAMTVRTSWLTPSKVVFRWAIEQKLIATNPFAGVKVTVPHSIKLREKAFTRQEAETILRAASAVDWRKGDTAAARRCVPWLQSYSGARVGEICQLRGCDVREVEGCPAMVLTPEAGTIKTRQARIVPLHEDLIGQGFPDFVASRGQGPLFGTGQRIGKHVAAWVRKQGVTDPGVAPSHSWRHLFKQLAARHDISERISAPATLRPASAGLTASRASRIWRMLWPNIQGQAGHS